MGRGPGQGLPSPRLRLLAPQVAAAPGQHALGGASGFHLRRLRPSLCLLLSPGPWVPGFAPCQAGRCWAATLSSWHPALGARLPALGPEPSLPSPRNPHAYPEARGCVRRAGDRILWRRKAWSVCGDLARPTRGFQGHLDTSQPQRWTLLRLEGRESGSFAGHSWLRPTSGVLDLLVSFFTVCE